MPQNFKEYSFKSAGNTEQELENLGEKVTTDIPIGIKTPISFGNEVDGLFAMHHDLDKQLGDNFRNLLMTNHGERLGHYHYGANLRELTFELGTENIDNEAMNRITQACQTYLPFIQLKEFIPFTIHQDNKDVGKIGVTVMYNIPQIGSFDKRIDVLLYVAG